LVAATAKGNAHHKLFQMDEFARRWYCQHARINQLRSDKRRAKKAARTYRKRLCRKDENDDA
jgi:hypothetical protein